MKERVLLARQALRKALAYRKKAHIGKYDPICLYDVLEEKFGIEIKFQRIKSMEGMFVLKNNHPIIIICSERPHGRQIFTCAHEFGHFVFGHGSKVDEYLMNDKQKSYYDPEEWLVDRFAGFFLMPKYAVEEAFKKRGWDWNYCSPFQVYLIAGQFGVGYETIIQHMRYSLQMLTNDHSKELLRSTPKQIRKSILNSEENFQLVIVDRHWSKIAIDIQIGDQVILPSGSLVKGSLLRVIGEHELGVLVEGQNTGTERVATTDQTWAVNIRVSRKFYNGRSMFRHLEEPNHE